MARGVDGRAIFVDDDDRKTFLRGITEVHSKLPFTLFAYCLMGNHFHLAIQAKEASLSRIMHRLLTKYSLTFNNRHDRSGHLFQARYKAVICIDETYLAALVRYIHLNPVRAGLTNRPEDWPWSSLSTRAWALDPAILPNAVRSIWSLNDQPGTLSDIGFEPWPELDEDSTPTLFRVDEGPTTPLVSIIKDTAERNGLTPDEILSKSRRRPVSSARREAVMMALRSGHRPVDVARFLKVTPSLVSRCYGQQVK